MLAFSGKVRCYPVEDELTRFAAQGEAVNSEAQTTEEKERRKTKSEQRSDRERKRHRAIASGEIMDHGGEEHIKKPATDLRLLWDGYGSLRLRDCGKGFTTPRTLCEVLGN